jgi:hypothetical protein
MAQVAVALDRAGSAEYPWSMVRRKGPRPRIAQVPTFYPSSFCEPDPGQLVSRSASRPELRRELLQVGVQAQSGIASMDRGLDFVIGVNISSPWAILLVRTSDTADALRPHQASDQRPPLRYGHAFVFQSL